MTQYAGPVSQWEQCEGQRRVRWEVGSAIPPRSPQPPGARRLTTFHLFSLSSLSERADGTEESERSRPKSQPNSALRCNDSARITGGRRLGYGPTGQGHHGESAHAVMSENPAPSLPQPQPSERQRPKTRTA
jgi:hypothetical protein